MTRGESLRRAAKLRKDRNRAHWGQGMAYSILVSLFIFFIFANDLTELIRSDRLAHFFVACVLTQIYFLMTPYRKFQALEAIVLALSFGALKEIVDPQMEFYDLIMNLLGAVFAVGIHIITLQFEAPIKLRSKA